MATVYTPAFIASMSASQLNALAPAAFAAFTAAQVQALTAAQLNALTPENVQALKANYFSQAQIAGLTSAIGNLSRAQMAAFTVAQMSGFSGAQMGMFQASALSALGASQTAALTAAQIAGIAASEVPSLSSGFLRCLSAAQLHAFADAQTAALTSAQLAALIPSQFPGLNLAALTTAQFGALTKAEVASIAPTVFARLVAPRVAELSQMARSGLTAAQMATLTAAQINALPVSFLASLTQAQTQGLSAATLNGLSATSFNALRFNDFSASQIAGLSTALSNLGAAQAAVPSAASLSRIAAANMRYLGSDFLSALGATQIAGFSAAQLNAIPASTFAHLATGFLNALSTAQLGALSQTLTSSLAADQLAGLSARAFSALNLAFLTQAQFRSLTSSEIGSLSIANFDRYVAGHLDLLSDAGLNGVTVAELRSMTPAQIAAITSAQLGAMNAAAAAYVTALRTPAPTDYDRVMSDLARLTAGGPLTFAAARTLLQNVSVGGVTTGEFSALTTVAYRLNAAAGTRIETSEMVRQLFDNVVLGNAANARWNGGASASVPLGNLSATSTQLQMSMLIGKWFLGTDNPSLAGTHYAAAYQMQTGPLFSDAGPQFTDVNQGAAGDCYFLSALAETALQNPSLIRNMITDDGGGVYTVQFHLNGQNVYITVDSSMPTMSGGLRYASGSSLEFDTGASSGSIWTEIVEKAYVEFRALTDGVNAWHAIDGGWDNGLAAITGQSAVDYYAGSYTTPAARGGLLRTLYDAFFAREDVLLSTSGSAPWLNLAGSHMYAVTNVNLDAGTITLDNPWNANGASSGMQMQFTASLADLANAGCTFHVATGTPALA